MKTVPIVINHSIPHFAYAAKEIADGLRECGLVPLVLTNREMWTREATEHHDKCVFFDKDVPLGLRLEIAGTRLYNNIGSIELCSDKRRTCALLKNDIPMPKTEIYPLTYFPNEAFFAEYSAMLADTLGFPLVAKLACGSQGREVFLLNTAEELTAFQREHYIIPHLYQQFIKRSRGRDLRVYMVKNEPVVVMLRENSDDFRSNIAMGGTAKSYELPEGALELCIDVRNLMGLDFCGIDLLFGDDGMLLCEVNSNALFNSADAVCGTRIGKKIAQTVNENTL